MAAGLPVVASDIPGYREVAGQPSAGGAVLVPPRDPIRLAAELTALLTEPERRAELGRRGQAWAAQFDWAQVARQVLEVYAAGQPAPQPARPDRLILASGP